MRRDLNNFGWLNSLHPSSRPVEEPRRSVPKPRRTGDKLAVPAHFQKSKPSSEKDRQCDPLYLTILWFRLACISRKTLRNTVDLSTTNGANLRDALLVPFVFQPVMRSAHET
jgi:hypothetical protein